MNSTSKKRKKRSYRHRRYLEVPRSPAPGHAQSHAAHVQSPSQPLPESEKDSRPRPFTSEPWTAFPQDKHRSEAGPRPAPHHRGSAAAGGSRCGRGPLPPSASASRPATAVGGRPVGALTGGNCQPASGPAAVGAGTCQKNTQPARAPAAASAGTARNSFQRNSQPAPASAEGRNSFQRNSQPAPASAVARNSFQRNSQPVPARPAASTGGNSCQRSTKPVAARAAAGAGSTAVRRDSSGSDEFTWEDEPLPPVERPEPRRGRQSPPAAGGGFVAATPPADGTETAASGDRRLPEDDDRSAADGTPEEEMEGEEGVVSAGQDRAEPVSNNQDRGESASSVETITVTVQYPQHSPAAEAEAVSAPAPESVDENDNWLPAADGGPTVATDGETWFRQVVSDTLRERLDRDSAHTPHRPDQDYSQSSALPDPRILFPPSGDDVESVQSDPGHWSRPAANPRTAFQPHPGDPEVTGVFYQSQEDLVMKVAVSGSEPAVSGSEPAVSGSEPAAPPPVCVGAIPLPPGSPLTGVPGRPVAVLGGSARLPGGAPARTYQPDGFAVRQWRPEAPPASGAGDWPSLQEVAGRSRAATAAPAPGSAAELTIREAVRFSNDGDWWTAPPPPPPPPPPGGPAPSVPGWPAPPRETTLEELVRPRPAPNDWWEPDGGAAAELSLRDLERDKTSTAPTGVPGTSGGPISPSCAPHHGHWSLAEGRGGTVTPPAPAGRGAWRPLSPTSPPAPGSVWRPLSPTLPPVPGAPDGTFTPRVLSCREPLRPGGGLWRSEPRPGGGFRPRYVPPEERLTAGGARRSLGVPPTTAAVDKCGPEAIAAFRRRMGCRAGITTAYDPEALVGLRLPVGFIDSHCHLDFLFRRDQAFGSGLRSNTLTEFRRRVASATFPASFAGCVAVFCDPNYWHRMLEHILRSNKNVVALGEIGLDYSTNNSTSHDMQKTVFRRQLAIGVALGLPLVLHVRDAEQDALDIALEMVPRDHLIHRHCITGNWVMVRRWMDAFPNCYVGLTPLITNPHAQQARFLVGEVPLNRLLLETDAPYFVPSCYRRDASEMRFSHPGLALHVAAQVSQMRRIPLEEVVRVTAANTRAMYRLPPQEREAFTGFSAQ
ncbi:trithorax group protein osa-like isoform X2 [Amphibalanus amphitrite]|uniref:trithorax group protein osa-like isoform X2 n=1 Tax=Amphibalanus amphitrite TaxID=1232801 RepID=UPI001C92A68C|nr:trithorax group protein osa-like isoform X2 [Amphibalanus amphitrite]